jgi:heme oxygenase
LPDESLRSLLRTRTAATHERLDAKVGHFSDIASYSSFAWHSLRFRAAMEPALARPVNGWSVDPLSALIRLDLRDLGTAVPTDDRTAPWFDAPQSIGAAYVIEGSALGARLLLRRAAALGLNDTFGARHLARQSADHGRWRDFLAVLDAVPATDHQAVLAGAHTAFDFALAIYSEQVTYERA